MIKIKKIYIDLKLIIFIITFMIISIITINSSMLYLPDYLGNLALKQAMWYISGFILIIIIFFFKDNYKYTSIFYLLNIFLLALLLAISNPINGSKCWLIIPKLGSIQPSEFMKIALILSISKIVADWTSSIKKVTLKQELKLIGKVLLILIPPTVLTFLEPDTGAILIYFIITLSILIVSPLRKRWFIILFILITVALISFIYIYFQKQDLFIKLFGTDLFYRIDRLLDWKNGTGMQLENSLTAIGSAGLKGHGYMQTPIYFPESGTDFIFAVYASNFGLIGCLALLLLLVLFDLYLLNIGKKISNIIDKYIIIGTVGMLLYQQIQNIGMTIGILPITGITLPFISYGGSSLLSYLLIIGIILKINNQNKNKIN